jgi:hypothetical protein
VTGRRGRTDAVRSACYSAVGCVIVDRAPKGRVDRQAGTDNIFTCFPRQWTQRRVRSKGLFDMLGVTKLRSRPKSKKELLLGST